MKCLVTGAAGFIGSHLCDRLLDLGHTVTGVDAFIRYYPRVIKERHLATARVHPRFQLAELDLRDPLPPSLLDGVEVIYHLAAVPGLCRSWSEYGLYESCNLRATQRLLTAAAKASDLRRFVHASTSSVYGRQATGNEDVPTRPVSPYGVTKLAAEALVRAYHESFGVPAVVLRYYSVYGPRQRPDMGYHRFIRAFVERQSITIYGDGSHVRGNTFVSDCVDATVRAAEAKPGAIYNVGGGETTTTLGVVHKLEAIFGYKVPIVHAAPRPGDQSETKADTSRIRADLGWQPRVGLDEGLRAQAEWQGRAVTTRRAA
jgi:nucleoside-diphosphate-sugar epimerase